MIQILEVMYHFSHSLLQITSICLGKLVNAPCYLDNIE
jgi:hypothetical protein